MSEWLTVAKASELGSGERTVFEFDGYYVAVFNVDGRYYAIEDACTHDNEPLAHGELEGYELECPRHGAKFDIRTGEALTMPAITPTHRFEVRVQDDEVQILFDIDE